MKSFHEMLKNITSSRHHDHMLRFAKPLNDHLGINHFWYYRITFLGFYSYLGTHSAWNEFCFDQLSLEHFPCLRHPNVLQSGISLMKTDSDSAYKNIQQIAWDKFQINFNLNLIKNIPEGIEAFGFATRFDDQKEEERLINELPTLRYFIKMFREKNKKLFKLIEDNQVDLSSCFGKRFYERQKILVLPNKRDHLLHKIGFEAALSLTTREIDVLRFISNGFPASYIAKNLKLSQRTIENYIATIKCKLGCNSKVDLILKAQEISSTGYFDHPF